MGEAALVSVIIPTYNYGHFIAEAIESVLAQSYRNFEIIVIDDGSTDSTKDVVSSFPEVRYLPQANQGIAPARNAGLLASRGEFLVFLDADDRLLPDALTLGIALLKANPECAFVSGQWELISKNGKSLPSPPINCIQSDHYRAFLHSNYVGTVGQVMFRRSILEAANGFDTSVPGCDDFELYLRLTRSYPVQCHDKVVLQHRRHGSNTSGKRDMMLQSALRIYQAQAPHVQGRPELESLQQQRSELCQRGLDKELKKNRQARIKANWLVKGIIQIRDRVRAELLFRRHTSRRRKAAK
ncbi:MAG TPA: glycosyltransferase [Pyrinomonadaceae bacterium]|jgi:glycosyltransferase involved in cell wall biosynthesis|nr:glycosyltransferase [Pyrinomonadaceae bacterium]